MYEDVKNRDSKGFPVAKAKGFNRQVLSKARQIHSGFVKNDLELCFYHSNPVMAEQPQLPRVWGSLDEDG